MYEISEITIDMIKDGEKFLFTRSAKPASAKTGEIKKDENQQAQTPEPEASWTMSNGKEGNSAELNTILAQLSDLRCFEFFADKKKEDFSSPIYTITLKGKKDYILSIYEKKGEAPKGDDKMYPAVSSENAYPFWLNSYVIGVVMKKPENLLNK